MCSKYYHLILLGKLSLRLAVTNSNQLMTDVIYLAYYKDSNILSKVSIIFYPIILNNLALKGFVVCDFFLLVNCLWVFNLLKGCVSDMVNPLWVFYM